MKQRGSSGYKSRSRGEIKSNEKVTGKMLGERYTKGERGRGRGASEQASFEQERRRGCEMKGPGERGRDPNKDTNRGEGEGWREADSWKMEGGGKREGERGTT